jgi:predicted component of type VI protein secretion system
MFELSIFLRDKLIGRSSFSHDEVRIGRSADNEVRIDNQALSRHHAAVESVAGIHLLKDFGSQNGTFVNGERVVGRTGLSDGDRIQLGKFTLVFRTHGQARVNKPEVHDEASYAVAGKTLVLKTRVQAPFCPWVGYLEEPAGEAIPPPRHPIDRDLFLVGSGRRCHLKLSKKSGVAEQTAIVVRAWGGFSLLAMAPGVERNEKKIELTTRLSDGDTLSFGDNQFAFYAGHPDG